MREKEGKEREEDEEMRGEMLYAVVRLRGRVDVHPEVRHTLRLLRLNRLNHCVVVPANEYYKGCLLYTSPSPRDRG